MLLVFGAPCQLRSLAGQEHGRTIPLGDIPVYELLRCTALCWPDCWSGSSLGLHRPHSSDAGPPRKCSDCAENQIHQPRRHATLAFTLCCGSSSERMVRTPNRGHPMSNAPRRARLKCYTASIATALLIVINVGTGGDAAPIPTAATLKLAAASTQHTLIQFNPTQPCAHQCNAQDRSCNYLCSVYQPCAHRCRLSPDPGNVCDQGCYEKATYSCWHDAHLCPPPRRP